VSSRWPLFALPLPHNPYEASVLKKPSNSIHPLRLLLSTRTTDILKCFSPSELRSITLPLFLSKPPILDFCDPISTTTLTFFF